MCPGVLHTLFCSLFCSEVTQQDSRSSFKNVQSFFDLTYTVALLYDCTSLSSGFPGFTRSNNGNKYRFLGFPTDTYFPILVIRALLWTCMASVVYYTSADLSWIILGGVAGYFICFGIGAFWVLFAGDSFLYSHDVVVFFSLKKRAMTVGTSRFPLLHTDMFPFWWGGLCVLQALIFHWAEQQVIIFVLILVRDCCFSMGALIFCLLSFQKRAVAIDGFKEKRT